MRSEMLSPSQEQESRHVINYVADSSNEPSGTFLESEAMRQSVEKEETSLIQQT